MNQILTKIFEIFKCDSVPDLKKFEKLRITTF